MNTEKELDVDGILRVAGLNPENKEHYLMFLDTYQTVPKSSSTDWSKALDYIKYLRDYNYNN